MCFWHTVARCHGTSWHAPQVSEWWHTLHAEAIMVVCSSMRWLMSVLRTVLNYTMHNLQEWHSVTLLVRIVRQGSH